MKKPKVLMLGWEFPPVISGGLGIACQGISRALSKHVSLTLILPKITEDSKLPGVKLIGLGNLKLEDVFEKEELKEFEKIIQDQKITIDISPYPEKVVEKISKEEKVFHEKQLEKKRTVKSVHNRFRDADLYGDNVIEKVKYYTEILERIAKDLEFDIIHAHDWMTFQAGLRLKEKYKKPLVIHVHSLNFDRIGLERESWVYQLEKNALEKADLIIPVSGYTGKVIREHYGVHSNKVMPVHNGIDPVKAFRTEKNFPEKLVLFLGRITLQKGPEYFLETANKVIQKYPEVRFAIVGEGDKLHEMIEEGAYREISHKLHFTGFIDRDKVRNILSMTDVFCMPSLSEPFGLTALEAVQFGVPIVITRRAGAAEVISSALLADFWDTDLMAEHIVRLLTDRNLYAEKVKQGKKDIKTITWNASAEKIIQGYKQVTA